MSVAGDEQALHLNRRMSDVVRDQPHFVRLTARLLALGGRHVVATHEEHLRKLLARGATRDGNTTFRKGEPCRCHANAAALHQDDARNRIVTGWALSKDGLWRQHSWCERDGAIIETTVERDRYFGFELTGDEADEFCFENI